MTDVTKYFERGATVPVDCETTHALLKYAENARRDTLLDIAGLARTKDRNYKALNNEAFDKFAQELERMAGE